MSESIQISNIVDDIFEEAKERLKHVLEREKEFESISTFDDTTEWFGYKSNQSGYFQNLSYKNILKFSQEHGTKLHLTIPKGLFILENDTFLKSEKKLDNQQLETFFSNINFSKSELVSDNYSLAFKQLTEIAVKAMSPGINDPGTAINAIDYLTELFALRMKKKDVEIYVDKENNSQFKLEVIPFKILLYNVMASLRTYCKHDPIVVQKLLWMLAYLKKQPSFDEEYTKAIADEIKRLKKDSKSIIEELNIEY